MRQLTLFGIVFTSTVLAAAAALAGAQEHPAAPHEHPEGQALTNSVEATRESIGTGRTRYVYACRQCHGNRGQGDGDMSHAGGVPSDFTDDIWQHGETDGEIYLVIRDGVSADMQPYQNQIPEEDIWHLVNYLKSLSK
jgi:mono/diheme cytochrome c family protein